MVSINVFPRSALIDEKLSIEILGLRPNSSVTVRALITECGKTYDSLAHFQADNTGCVDNYHESLGGTYSGIQCMGLFTSMLPSPKEKRGTRLIKKDTTKPLITDLMVLDGFYTREECYNSKLKVLSSTRIERWYMSKDVERIPVKCGNIRGMLFKPKGCGPFPGVIDLFGGSAMLYQFRSALLASHGFASLALPYYGVKDLPMSLTKVTVDYFEEAVDWLLENSFVQQDGIGLVGVCLGGELALRLSTLCGPKIKACVSINGCPFSNSSHPSNRYKQKMFPSAPVYPDKVKIVNDAVIFVDYFTSSLKKEDRCCMSKLEESECEYLFISGDDDKCWNASEYAKTAANYLRSKGKTNWTVVSYPNAGHLIEPPYSPLCATVYFDFVDMICEYGGQHDGHAIAQEDSWKKILEFLCKYVGNSATVRRTTPSIASVAVNSKL